MSALVLIPLLPLLGFLFNGLLGRRVPRLLVSLVACGLPALAFVLSLGLFMDLVAGTQAISATVFTWAATAGLQIDATLVFDPVSAVMCLVITGIGTLIHVYSVGYMHDDDSYSRYFAYLNLFLFFMLLLVLGGNLVVMFVGWEGVGLASYLLIGFWFRDADKTAAGLKAFVVNRVGDTGFILAAFLLHAEVGSLDFGAINAHYAAGGTLATLIGLLLLVGACGKSAQIPLHVWLPDAMAGPTPVSALIHAATMVTAGVYLLARLNGLFLATPDAMTVITWLGALTALAGATMGMTAYNLKKVLAYSTMSQIGLMVMACGLGAYSVALFHLMTHAFFKACLFLGAGAVLHALAGEEDMRRMGGLARSLPVTFGLFLVATLALCGVPPLAGFFSKDEILWMAWASVHGGTPLLWLVAGTASFLTAFYMFRAVFMTFLGTSRVAPSLRSHLHDPPPSMAGVLWVLAAGSVVVGFIGLPQLWREALGVSAPFYDFLDPVLGHASLRAGVSHSTEAVLMVLAVLLALSGIALAWWRFGRGAAVPAVEATAPAQGLQALVQTGYGFDHFYEQVVVRGAGWVSTRLLGHGVEAPLTETSLEQPGRKGLATARWLARLQTGNVQAYLVYALVGLAFVLGWGATHG